MMGVTLGQIASVYGGPDANREDQAKAADYYLRALALIDPNVYRRAYADFSARLGVTYLRRNDIPQAKHYFDLSLPLARAIGVHQVEGTIEFQLGAIDKAAGRYVDALAHFERTSALFAKSANKWYLVRADIGRAEMLAELGRKKESLEALARAKAMLPEVNAPSLEALYYPDAARVYARLGEYEQAYRQMLMLKEADKRLAEAANAKLGNELRVRFEVQLKEAENVLLRSQQKEAESRRLALSLALALSILLFISVAYYLRKRASAARMRADHHQALATVEAKRSEVLQAANATLEHLANIGHEITATLDANTVFAALYRHTKTLFDISSFAVWIVEEAHLHLRFSSETIQETSVPLDSPTASITRAAREPEVVLVEDQNDEGTLLHSPLQAGGDVIGVLSIQMTKAQAVGERELQIVRTLSAYGAVALSNAAHAQQLRAANQAKSTFLANMSHELRSPLNAMMGFTRLLLRDTTLSREAQGDLGIVLRSGEHLYTLINQVLDLSKIEAGRVVLSESDFDLYALLDEIGEMFSIAAQQKGLQLSINSQPDVPQYVYTDSVKLRQVLINLMSNAIKFTSQGSVVLNVERKLDEDRAVVSFRVTDTGVGIAAEEQNHLGNAFTQAKAGQRAQEGTGLGLAISRSFVQLMGGKFKLSSQLNLVCPNSF